MEGWLIALILIILVAVVGIWMVRRRTRDRPQPQPTDGTTVVIRQRVPKRPRSLRERIGALPLTGTLTALLVIGLLVSGSVWSAQRFGWIGADTRLVVAVAPFGDADGGRTGGIIANQVVELLAVELGSGVQVVAAPSAPADAAAALALAERLGVDMLLWGNVEPGALLDSLGLTPRLILIPRAPLAANAWQGYSGRFVMPRSFTLTTEPVNGRALLPPLLTALGNYLRDDPDLAFAQLGGLQLDYPLAEALPRTLRGQILWARQLYSQAASEYRLALEAPGEDRAFLANNLGAVLLDGGDREGARVAFSQAVELLNGYDLGELRVNLGMLAQAEGRFGAALSEFEQARRLLGANHDLLVLLSERYRDEGRLSEARATLNSAEALIDPESMTIPEPFRIAAEGRMRARQDSAAILLSLAELVGNRGPLLWALEVEPPLSAPTLSDLRGQAASAARRAETSVDAWRRRSAAESAAGDGAGLIAGGQAEQAEMLVEQLRFVEALAQLEADRGALSGPRQGFFGAIFGPPAPMGESLSLFTGLGDLMPDSPEMLVSYGRALRLADQVPAARQRFDQAVAVAPNRPEGFYGLASVSIAAGDGQGAREQFNQALALQPDFFPARLGLAQLAEANGDLAAAIEQYRAIAQRYPAPESVVQLADALRRAGPERYEEAQQVLLPLSSQSGAVMTELGYLYRDWGQLEAAQAAFRDALTLDPSSAMAAFELGRLLEANQEFVAAADQYRVAIDNDPDMLDARIALADLYLGPLERPQDATEQYRAALQIGVRNPEQALAIGDALFREGSYTYAIQAYEGVAAEQPTSPAVQLRLARANLALGRLNAALNAAQTTVGLTDGRPDLGGLRAEALTVLGRIELERNDSVAAQNFFGEALSLEPARGDALIGRGRAAAAQGNWGLALADFEQAVLAPGGAENPEANFWLAEALLRAGAFSRAITTYQQALTLQPTFPEALLGLAQTQAALGDGEAAEATIDAALRQRPAYAEGLLFKGRLLQERGQIEAAIAAYDSAAAANSEIGEIYYRRGVLLISRGEYGRAINDLRRASELEPNNAEAFYWLGRALYAQSNEQTALDALRRATSLQPAFSEAYFYQGLVEEDLGLRDEAVTSYGRVLELDTAGVWGDRARAQLERIN